MFPEMRLTKRQVNEDTAKSYLEKGKYGILGTISDNGYPYTVPVNYIYYKDDIYIHCSKKGHKMDNIRACDKISFSVVTYEDIDEKNVSADYESVTILGTATIVPEEDRMEIYNEIMRKLTPSYEDKASYIAKYAPAAEVIKIQIQHIRGKARYEKRLFG